MVKLADTQDIDEIINIEIEIQKEAWEEEYIIEDEKLKDAYKKYFEKHLNEDCFVFVRKNDNKIAAISILLMQDNLPCCKDISEQFGYVTGVSTLKEFRNKGYQHELMKFLIGFAKEKHIKTLTLDSSNPIAIKLYEKYNFEIYEKDRVIMQLYLEN